MTPSTYLHIVHQAGERFPGKYRLSRRLAITPSSALARAASSSSCPPYTRHSRSRRRYGQAVVDELAGVKGVTVGADEFLLVYTGRGSAVLASQHRLTRQAHCGSQLWARRYSRTSSTSANYRMGVRALRSLRLPAPLCRAGRQADRWRSSWCRHQDGEQLHRPLEVGVGTKSSMPWRHPSAGTPTANTVSPPAPDCRRARSVIWRCGAPSSRRRPPDSSCSTGSGRRRRSRPACGRALLRTGRARGRW
jgi:hypothetical protein